MSFRAYLEPVSRHFMYEICIEKMLEERNKGILLSSLFPLN
jgi:hypothetical protein